MNPSIEEQKLNEELKMLNMNIYNLLRDISSDEKIIATNEIEIVRLKKETSALMENIEYTFGPIWQQIKDNMFDMKCLIQKHEEEKNKLRLTCQSQTRTIENLRNKMEETKTSLYHQGSYSTSVGLNLSGLLWKATKEQDAVRSLIHDGRLIDFFCIASNAIKHFFNYYTGGMPDSTSDEVQFIVCLIGVVANVAATQQGREYISNTPQGRDMVQQLVVNVSQIPKTCLCIQRLMLMCIFNISIHTLGSKLIVNHPQLLQLLIGNSLDSSSDLKFISLKLLQSITYNIEDESWLSVLQEVISYEKLNELEKTSSYEEQTFISGIRNNIKAADANFWKMRNNRYNAT